MKLNAKQLAENLGVSYVVSAGLIKLLLSQKQIEVVDKVFHPSGKGKPTKFYSFPEELTIAIKEVVSSEVEQEPVLEQEVIEEVQDEPVLDQYEAETQEPEPVMANTSENWYWDDEDEDDE